MSKLMDDALEVVYNMERSKLIETNNGLDFKLSHSFRANLRDNTTVVSTYITFLEDLVLVNGINNIYLKGKLRDDVEIKSIESVASCFIDGDNVLLLRKSNMGISIFVEDRPTQTITLKGNQPSFCIYADKLIVNSKFKEGE